MTLLAHLSTKTADLGYNPHPKSGCSSYNKELAMTSSL